MKKISADNLNVQYHQKFIDEEDADRLLRRCERLFHKQKKDYPKRRSNITIGDEGVSYQVTFGNNTVTRVAESWDLIRGSEDIRHAINSVYGQYCNYAVIQRYPVATTEIKPHRDKEINPDTMIFGLSLGATRKLELRRGNTIHRINLSHGSLYVLLPPTNDYWSHAIPPGDVDEVRFSITFRTYV